MRFAIPNPKTKRWTGQFRGEFGGNVWFARNIDLERQKGALMLADSYSDNRTNLLLGIYSELETAFLVISVH